MWRTSSSKPKLQSNNSRLIRYLVCVPEFTDLSGNQVSLVILHLHGIEILLTQRKEGQERNTKYSTVTMNVYKSHGIYIMTTIPPLSSLSASCCEVDCRGPARAHWAHLHTLGWGLRWPPSQPGPDAGFLHRQRPHRRPPHSLTHHWLPIRYRRNNSAHKPSSTVIIDRKCKSFTPYPIGTPLLGLPLI